MNLADKGVPAAHGSGYARTATGNFLFSIQWIRGMIIKSWGILHIFYEIK